VRPAKGTARGDAGGGQPLSHAMRRGGGGAVVGRRSLQISNSGTAKESDTGRWLPANACARHGRAGDLGPGLAIAISKLMPGRRLAVPLRLLSLTRCGVAINDQSVSTLTTHCRQQASTVLLNWENYALLLLPTNTADRNSSFYTADAGISKKFEDPLKIQMEFA